MHVISTFKMKIGKPLEKESDTELWIRLLPSQNDDDSLAVKQIWRFGK